jgi:hypothetical protein
MQPSRLDHLHVNLEVIISVRKVGNCRSIAQISLIMTASERKCLSGDMLSRMVQQAQAMKLQEHE